MIELQQVGVDQHEIADRHAARRDPLRRQDHDADETGGHDRALADIEQRQRRLAPDRGALIGLERAVVALGLVRLVGEVFDRLVV